jgi:uncharacterized protein involved in exopolysaccharide biosynthesis
MTSYAPPKLRQIVTEAVFRQKRLFGWTVVLIVGLVALVTLVVPKRYSSTSKLLVQNVRSVAPLTTTPEDKLMAPNMVSAEEINSEVDLLESQGVARRALGQDPARPESKAQEDAVTALLHHLTVEPIHATQLVNVSLVGKSPTEASAQLQRLINAYFEERAGTAISTGAAGFFEGQVQGKAQQLQDDQQQLTDFEVAHGIADLDDQKKLQVERIAGLQNQLLAAQAQLAAQRSKTAADKRELSMTPARSRTIERTITNQYSQERLNTELVDLENRRTELLKRYPPTDRQVIEANEKIATTQKAIATASTNPAGEEATDVNPVYQQLSAAVANATGEASGVAAQAAELSSQLKEAQARLGELEQATATYDELKRNLAQAQADYTLYAQKRDQAQIAQALDKAKMFDVSLVQPPIASSVPVRPKPVLYLSAGTLFALLLATLLALYEDTSSEQVYTPSQLDALTGTRTIATIAEESADDQQANRLEYRRILLAIRNGLREIDESVSESGHETAALQSNGRVAGYCVAFVSALAAEGTSYLVNNLATEAARQASSRVAVLAVGPLLRKFEAEEDLSFGMKYDEAGEHWVLDLENANQEATVPLRRGNMQGLFSARLRPLLVEARKEFDFVFLDCPSFQASTLAGELDRSVDGYVAVVAAARSRKQNIDGMAAAFRETRSPLLGYVLNRRTYPVPTWVHRVLW